MTNENDKTADQTNTAATETQATQPATEATKAVEQTTEVKPTETTAGTEPQPVGAAAVEQKPAEVAASASMVQFKTQGAVVVEASVGPEATVGDVFKAHGTTAPSSFTLRDAASKVVALATKAKDVLFPITAVAKASGG